MTEIEYFSRLGSMLGYYPFTEDTCNGKNRPMDLTWRDNYDGEYWHNLILHLERENLFDKDEKTLDKLFCDREFTPKNAIGIMNVRNRERIVELVKIAKATRKVENALLVFRTTSSGKSQTYFDEVHAHTFSKYGDIDFKKAHVSEIGGTLYMQFCELCEKV